MLKYHLKFAFRNLTRFKVYSIINILGLAVGMACTILIYLWVQDELSFDNFHKNSENIYRVVQTQYYTAGEPLEVDVTQLGMAQYCKENIPGIESSTRYTRWSLDFLIQYKEKSYIEKVHMVDSTFLKIFSFKLIKGNINKVLSEPYSIVLTDEMS